MSLSESTKQEVQSTLREAESRLKAIVTEIKELESRYEDLLSQRKVVEKQLWLAKLVLSSNNETNQKVENRKKVEGRFFDKTIPEAAEEIIEEKGRMLSSREIVEVLLEGGRVFANMTNATASVTTSIKRHPETFFWKTIGGVNRFGLVKNRSNQEAINLKEVSN